MENNPKVSIITTYYNSVKLGDFVKKSMECLLNQTYQNIEFVCVHDGSPDDTLSQLKEYQEKDSRIIIIDKSNEGTAQYAKAAGQDIASGEYIMLFDHDDTMSLDAVEKAVNKFQENPNLDMVGFIVKTIYANGKIRSIKNLDIPLQKIGDFRDRTLTGKECLIKTVGRYDVDFRGFYKKEIFKSVSFRFTERLLNADEIVERMILERVNNIGICNAVYTHYIYMNSSAKSFNLKKIDILKTNLILRDYFKKLGFYEDRKSIFELTSYKDFINGVKVYAYFEKNLTKEQKSHFMDIFKKTYQVLDKTIILSQFKGISKFYNRILLSNFNFLLKYYQLKNKFFE
jgi:glycosyltransferase, group 2 family